MQLVDPEEIPAVERLTQEVLMLREKVAIAESRGQEATGNRRQQVLCHMRQAEMCLYFCWCSVPQLCFQSLDLLRCAWFGSWCVCSKGSLQRRGLVPCSTCLKGRVFLGPGVTLINLIT